MKKIPVNGRDILVDVNHQSHFAASENHGRHGFNIPFGTTVAN
jgi:hypothetical protein